MFNHRIGRHEVLLPINHNYNIICDILRFFLIKTREILRVSFASSEKMPFKRAYCPIIGVTCTVLLHYPFFFVYNFVFIIIIFFLLHHPICDEIRTVDSQSDLRILLCMINQEILVHYFVIFSL